MDKLSELPDPEPQNTDFIKCIHTREKFALNEINGFRSATIVNMGVCALRLNRSSSATMRPTRSSTSPCAARGKSNPNP